MAPPDKWLLPPTAELEVLSDEKVKTIVALADSQGGRNHAYALVGMLCGTVSFLGCLGSYVYLVMQHTMLQLRSC